MSDNGTRIPGINRRDRLQPLSTANPMSERNCNVLFLCTGNSCRSIMAETLLNHSGRGRFRAFSAGSHPAGRVNPRALAALERLGVAAGESRSKSWDEFARPGAPVMDVVITVCDNAAGEVCPVWPGRPVSAHWGVTDPAIFRGNEAETAAEFDRIRDMLGECVAQFIALPSSAFSGPALEGHLNEIGRGGHRPQRQT